jgi:DNA-binding MarR family transcriptional regulator
MRDYSFTKRSNFFKAYSYKTVGQRQGSLMDDERYSMYELCLLQSRADRALRVMVVRQLERHNLTMMEWLLLATVSQAGKTGLTMTEVAQMLDVTLPQVTALMGRLSKQKFIRQKVSSADRRSRLLISSKLGLRTNAAIEDTIREVMRVWLHDIDTPTLYTYIETMQQIANLDIPDHSS